MSERLSTITATSDPEYYCPNALSTDDPAYITYPYSWVEIDGVLAQGVGWVPINDDYAQLDGTNIELQPISTATWSSGTN